MRTKTDGETLLVTNILSLTADWACFEKMDSEIGILGGSFKTPRAEP